MTPKLPISTTRACATLLVAALAVAAPASAAGHPSRHARAVARAHAKARKHSAVRHGRRPARAGGHAAGVPASPAASGGWAPATPIAAPPLGAPAPILQAAPQALPPAASPAVAPEAATAPAPARLFSPASVWNAPLGADAALDPNSQTLVSALQGEVSRELQDRSGPWINTDRYSTPVYTVGPDVAPTHVTLDTWAPDLQAAVDAVPIPPGAVPAGGGDASLTIYQPSTDTLWEFWLAQDEADGWHARWGGRMTNVSSNPGYFPAPYGATATSLPLAGGLITLDDLRRGEIDHAVAVALPDTAAGAVTWPAQRTDGQTSGPGAIPEGTRFRVDPSLDLAALHLSPVALMIARAAQRYGMIVRDTASCFVFYAEDPAGAGGGDPYGQIFQGQYPNDLLSGFPWQALEAVAPTG